MVIKFDFRSLQSRRISRTESETLYKSATTSARRGKFRALRSWSRFALESHVTLSGPLIRLFYSLRFPPLSRVRSTFPPHLPNSGW